MGAIYERRALKGTGWAAADSELGGGRQGGEEPRVRAKEAE